MPAGRLPRYKEVILLNDLIDCARPGEEIVKICLIVLFILLCRNVYLIFLHVCNDHIRRSQAFIQTILTYH